MFQDQALSGSVLDRWLLDHGDSDMKLRAAALAAAMLGVSTIVALPAAGASVVGRAPVAAASGAHAVAAARCFWVDRLALRGCGVAGGGPHRDPTPPGATRSGSPGVPR